MKKLITILGLVTMSFTASAHTLSAIRMAYELDVQLKGTKPASFEFAMDLIETGQREMVVQGKNLLMRVKEEQTLSVNRKAAVNAAINLANETIEEIDLGGK